MIEGRLESDVVQVAGFVIDRQVIGVVTNMRDLKQNGIDGSLGLGLTDLTYNGIEYARTYNAFMQWSEFLMQG